MPVTLPLEVYEALEKGLGKEDARKVIHGIEETISQATEYKWATTKDEIIADFRKEISSLEDKFVTKELFEERMNTLRTEMLGRFEALYEKTEKDKAELLGIMKQDKAELLGKIENLRITLDRKFTIMFLILLFTIIFLNQNALEFMARILGLIK
ncbi:MAG: hypothetical protein Fur0020_11110 [Thermodesulfovibrionia bacterium]